MNQRVKEDSSPMPKPQQTASSKMLGVYPQRQDGLYMQRIRILGGRLSWMQWRVIAEIAEIYTPGVDLHITNRQDIELHNVREKDIATIHKKLGEAGLSVFAAGGDSLRNITVCCGCQFDPNAAGVYELARFVDKYLQQGTLILDLPRKFKISFSGCRLACAKPWINDMGFIAQRDGLFTAIGAGSLGARPAVGIELYRNLPVKDVLALCVCAIEFFKDYGDRKNRYRARLRHVREKLGDKAFHRELDKRFNQSKISRQWPDFVTVTNDKNKKRLWRLQLPDGNICAEDALTLADAAEPKAAELRINLEHGLELYGTNTFQLPQNLACLENDKAIIIVCPGLSTCSRAIADSRMIAEKIKKMLSNKKLPAKQINISGCPNNCVHSNIAQIGLVGMLSRENGQRVQGFAVFTGGGGGKNNKPAEKKQVFTTKNIPQVVERLLLKGHID